MLKKMIQKNNEICVLKKEFKKQIQEQLAKMGLYSSTRVKVFSDHLDLETQQKFSAVQIETLERKFNIKMTRYEYRGILNLGEPLEYFVNEGEKNMIFFYRFR